MNWAERAEAYLDHLSLLGYRPMMRDEDIYFRCEGGNYFIYPDDDEQFLQLVYPGFWPIDDDGAMHRALVAASRVNARIKVAKIVARADGRNLDACAEVFLARPEDFIHVFDRMLSVLQSARRIFVEEMTKSA
jgi:hypothetical protein